MAEVTTLFWDIGGVLLTNGWDHDARRRAVERFGLDPQDFETRHQQVVAPFETRQMTLQEYLWETVFYHPRPFTREDFRQFMFAQSQPFRETLRIAQELKQKRRYLMASINNEALELNLHRVRQFELRDCLSAFFSSCFLGARKPGPEIYCRSLELTQCAPAECIMIDDRPENLEAPRELGMRTIRYRTPAGLREELARHGIASALASG